MKSLKLVYFSIFLFCIFHTVTCWDNVEMQMFDLVEEVNQTFYEYFGVYQNASNSDIRKAYRKLSLIHHPDKNPNSEDSVTFRKIVAIYEILRDESTREKYDQVLKFGLPDWRMSAFYFRKLRKMSFVESFLLFSILATIIHYACLWGAFFEQKLNMEDYLFRRKKKRNNESEMTEQLNTVYKPRWKDALPLAIVKFLFNFIVSLPQNVKFGYTLIKKEIMIVVDKKYEQKRKDKAKDEEKKRIEEIKRQKKERKQLFSKENQEKRKIYEIGKQNAMTLPVETFNDIPLIEEDNKIELLTSPWADRDTVAVIEALRKFPAGVSDRWTKISDFVKRPLNEVTKKVKEIQASSREGKIPINSKMQNSLGEGVEEQFEQQVIYIEPRLGSVNCVSESEEEDDDDDDDDRVNMKSSAQKKKERKKMAKKNVTLSEQISKSDIVMETVIGDGEEVDKTDDLSVHQRKKPRTKVKYLETTEPLESTVWTQAEQRQLEDAMRSFPKGTLDRWDRISQKIPTKNKTECIERIKKLSQSIQEKNTNNS